MPNSRGASEAERRGALAPPPLPAYDDSHVLAVEGTGPFAEGENLRIRLGEIVFLGRSRHCAWSLKRTPAWLRSQGADRESIRGGISWRSTSRRHCRLSFLAPDLVEVTNLSPNGTLVDGHRVDRIVLRDCRTRVHTVQLGPHGAILALRAT